MNHPNNQVFGVKRPIAKLLLSLLMLLLLRDFVVAQVVTTAAGFSVRVNLIADKETILMGEPTFLSFQITNISTEQVCVIEGGDYRNRLGRPNSFKVTVTKEDGSSVPQPKIEVEMGGLFSCVPIPANGMHAVRLFLPDWATFQSPGDYTVVVSKPLSISSGFEKSLKQEAKAETSASTRIQVLNNNLQELDRLAEKFGKEVLQATDKSSNEAVQVLDALGNTQARLWLIKAISHLAEIPAGKEQHYSFCMSVAAMRDHESEALFEALKTAIKSPIAESRRAVADFLRSSGQAQSIKLLQTLWSDTDHYTRYFVAQGLAKADFPEAVPILQLLLQDEAEDVRKTAAESLKRLKQ